MLPYNGVNMGFGDGAIKQVVNYSIGIRGCATNIHETTYIYVIKYRQQTTCDISVDKFFQIVII